MVAAAMHQVLLGRPMAPLQDKTMVLRRADSRRTVVAAAAVAASAAGVQGVERKPRKVRTVQRSRPQLLGLLVATQTTVAARPIIIVAVGGVAEQENAVTNPTAQVAQQFLRQHLLQCNCALPEQSPHSRCGWSGRPGLVECVRLLRYRRTSQRQRVVVFSASAVQRTFALYNQRSEDTLPEIVKRGEQTRR